jgi:glycosyltransferase involved in cell wall biosynthesis
MDQRLRLHLVPWMVAGVKSQFVHLEKELKQLDLDLRVSEVHPWVESGLIEKLPLPSRSRGTIRSLMTLRQTFQIPADAIWTQVAIPLLPYLLTSRGSWRSNVFYAIDCTPNLLFDLGRHYRALTTDPDSTKGRLTTAALRSFFKRCAGLLPWSNWAAQSMIDDYGADPARVLVLPPGIDLTRWRPATRPVDGSSRVRLLFVGADFERKGGRLLLDLYRRHLRDECDLLLVSRAHVSPEPGVTAHSGYGPDDDGLLRLFQSSDILVVPTFADCFSMVAIEAMACGLPVITSRTGGIPEIVADGKTGYLIDPGDEVHLLETIRALVARPELRSRLGHAGREAATHQFDAATQARRLVALIQAGIDSRTIGLHDPSVARPVRTRPSLPADSPTGYRRIGRG